MSFHAYLEVWIRNADVTINTMVGSALAVMQSSTVPAYNSSVSALRDAHAVIVTHHTMAPLGAREPYDSDAAEVLASDVSIEHINCSSHICSAVPNAIALHVLT